INYRDQMNASNHQPSVTIKQWEDAGASLVAALGNYMDLCLKLTPSSLGEGINPKNVAIRIDPTAKAIFKEITEIGSTLARTRNRLVSPLLQLPEEIISIIFTHYVFDRMIPDPSRPSSLAQEVWHIHYGLDTLIPVSRHQPQHTRSPCDQRCPDQNAATRHYQIAH
ncbi:hypothetical protein RSAG8_08841, partial [Rhizoctonia solani AG-8 WAC10335]